MTSTAPAPAAPKPPVPAPPRPPEVRGGRSGLLGLLDLPGQAVRAIVRSAARTPGRLTVIAVGLVLLSLFTGLIATLSVQNRNDTITGLIDHREPLAAASQQVYRSLSDADATAASAFLSIGTEPAALRQRYERDVAEAGAALAKAASDSAGVEGAAAPVDTLSRQMPVYTGLVETARANNRQGFPAGASYLREASELMRAKILPAAQDLYRVDAQRLVDEQVPRLRPEALRRQGTVRRAPGKELFVRVHQLVSPPRQDGDHLRHQEWFVDHVRIERRFLDGFVDPVGGSLRPRDTPGHGYDIREPDLAPYRVA